MRCLYKKIGSFLALALVLCPLSAFANEWKMSLEQSIERGIAENRDIAIAKERLAELDGLKLEALSTGLPQFNMTGNYTRTHRRPLMIINGLPFRIGTTNALSAGVQFDQLLFDGGKVVHAYKAAKSEMARGIETIKDAEQKIRLGVKDTYHEILYTDKVIEVLEKQLKQYSSHLASIEGRFSKGLESDYTLMRQQVQVSNIEPQIIDAKRNKELLTNAMKVLLAIPQGDDYVPLGEFDYRAQVFADISELVEKAKGNRPDLMAEKYRIQSLMQNVSVEKTGYIPSLKFSSAFQWQANSDDFVFQKNERTDYLSSTVTLSWAIFDGLKTHAKVKQAKAKLLQQQYSTSQMEDNVIKEVRDAHESLVKARSALASQQKSLDLARKASKIAGERFESGLMSQLELNDTITSQAVAEQNYLRAAFDCMNAEAALDKAVGGGT